MCDEDIGDVRYGQIFTTQLSDRPHGHRRSYRPGRIWRIDLRVYFASRRRALISRLWASRRSSNKKEKELRRALRCRRSSSGSADFDRKNLRVDGVSLNI